MRAPKHSPARGAKRCGCGVGNAVNQGSGWAFAAANGGARMDASAKFTTTKTTRNVTLPSNLGQSYVKIDEPST